MSDPVWEVPAAILVTVAFALQEGLRWRFLGLLLFIDAIVPFIFFLLMLYHKQIDSWDIRKRKQRLPIYAFTLLCHLGGIWMAHEVGKTELAQTLLVFYGIALTYVGVTFFWKISLHAGVNTLLITSLNMFAGWRYWYLYAILPLVWWARHYQKHHTWAQLAVGSLLSLITTYLGLSWVGY